MEQAILDKNDLSSLLMSFKDDYTVLAPQKNKEDIDLCELKNAEDIVLDYQNFKKSVKQMFFPQCEQLCTFDSDGAQESPTDKTGKILFGIRPCDAASISQMDKVFSGEDTGYTDPYWKSKRNNSVIISLACTKPATTCFCLSFEGKGPCSEKGADILVTDLGGKYLFQGITEKGKELLNHYSAHFKEAGDDDLKAKEIKTEEVNGLINKIETEGVPGKLNAEFFESPVWKDMFLSCIGCGTCTFLCPTCHCFDITDETDGEKGRRIRTWDSCQFSLFTLHTSGHNPRPSKRERMRQRILHKFSYTVSNFNEIFCVGCGRCVRSCPVNLDIREMVDTIRTFEEPEK